MSEPTYTTHTPVEAKPTRDKPHRLSRQQRRARRMRELKAENELLHKRLAAIYDALTLD